MSNYIEPSDMSDTELLMAGVALLLKPVTYKSTKFERSVYIELLARIPEVDAKEEETDGSD